MRISLSPQGPEEPISVSVNGDILTINGDTLDLSVVTEGADIEDSLARSLHPMIAGPIYRQDGELHVTVKLPLPVDCSDPWMCFPDPQIITEDGPVDLPFATYDEAAEQKVEGGTNIITATRRWHQPDTVDTVFIPDPPPPETPEEAA